MKRREAEYHACSECGSRKQVSAEEVLCDHCGKLVAPNSDLACRITVFFHYSDDARDTESFEFDTFECAMIWLKSYQPPQDFYFIDMPMLSGIAQVQRFQDYIALPVARVEA